jgi:hypothetical protein
MKTYTLSVHCVNLSAFMETLNQQELDDLCEILENFSIDSEGKSLMPTSSFQYELSASIPLDEKFANFRESENYAFHYINLSE